MTETNDQVQAPTHFGVTTDYEYTSTHKRERIMVWSGPFYSVFEAEGFSLRGGGYMLTTHNNDQVRVVCPSPRTEENYLEVDAAISAALTAHYIAIGAVRMTVPVAPTSPSIPPEPTPHVHPERERRVRAAIIAASILAVADIVLVILALNIDRWWHP